MIQESQELKEVKGEFEKWRTTRIKKEPIPERLWSSALKLLKNHSLSEVSKNLGVSFNQLKQLYWLYNQLNQQNQSFSQQNDSTCLQPNQEEKFLELSVEEISTSLFNAQPLKEQSQEIAYQQKEQSLSKVSSSCQLIFERKDGVKLSMSLPLDWTNLSLFCSNLLK